MIGDDATSALDVSVGHITDQVWWLSIQALKLLYKLIVKVAQNIQVQSKSHEKRALQN